MQTILTRNGFSANVDHGTFTRSFVKSVNVVFHGVRETTLTCQVIPHGSGLIRAVFVKDGRVIKAKIYSFGSCRAWNAIRQTINNLGFEL